MIYNTEPQAVEILLKITHSFNRLQIDHTGLLVESKSLDQNQWHQLIAFEIDQNQSADFDIKGKTDQDTVVENGQVVKDAFVEVEKIWVNGILIESWAITEFCSFLPIYSASNRDYALQYNLDLPQEIRGTLSFFYNGRFSIDLRGFFPRYHSLLTRSLQNYNHWVIHGNLGLVDPSVKQELRDMISHL